MSKQIYDLLFKHACSKGQAWLQKNKALKIRDLVRKFFDDKIDFLRFVSIRVSGQKIDFDENMKDETIRSLAKAIADPNENIYTSDAVIKILDRFNIQD